MKAVRGPITAAAVLGLVSILSIPLAAAPIGTLSVANVANGVVSVTATGIDWQPPVGGGFGDISVGGNTDITYSGGTLTGSTNPYGQIKDVSFGAGTVTNFIQFYTPATVTTPTPPGTGVLQPFPVFDLVAVAPGGSAQGALDNCAGVTALGVSCSPLVSLGATSFVSPFVLTNRGAYTDISLGVTLLGRDADGNIQWTGGYTTQINNITPSDIQARINAGNAVVSTYSGQFVASAVPEPGTIVLLGSGLVAAGLIRRRVTR